MPSNPDPATYALLYEQARGTLARQESAVDEVRERTGVLFAASSVVVAFLGPAALDDGLGISGQLGLLAFLVGCVLAIGVLFPAGGWVFGAGLDKMFGDFVEADPPLTLPEIHRELAIHHAGHIESNGAKLNDLYWLFRGATLAMAIQVVALLFDIPTV